LKLSIFILLIFLLLTTTLCAAPLTLDECIQRGLNHNPEVKAYQLSVDEAEQGINEAWGAFLPTLTVSYNYNQLSNGSSSERDTDYLDQDSESVNCRLSQPLFSGLSGIAGLKRARQSRDYRQTELSYMQQQLVREIRVSFYSWVLNKQLVSKWLESIARLEHQKKIATAWVEQQLSTRLRLLDIQVELSNARHELIRTEADLAISKARLREWLAFDDDKSLLIDGGFSQNGPDQCADLESCITRAIDQRPELTLAQLQIGMARQDAKSILARNLPQAQIDASWVDYQREYDVDSYSDDERDYYSVSFNLSISPFQGGRNFSAWRRQKIAVERYVHQLAKQRHAIATDVETRFHQLNESRARIENNNDAIKQAREAYLLAFKSAELGVVSLDDLLESELRLTRVEINLINSHYSLQLAKIQMDFSLGNETFLP